MYKPSYYSSKCCTLACSIEDKPARKLGPASKWPASAKTIERYEASLRGAAKRAQAASRKTLRASRKAEIESHGCFLPSAQGAFPSEATSWQGAKQRANNPKGKDAHYYDGVDIDPRWAAPYSGFDAFLTDMGPKPDPSYTIDRIDSSRGYWADNCRWACKRTQSYLPGPEKFLSELWESVDQINAYVSG